MDDRWGRWQIPLLLGIYLVFAAFLPAADDEVYYWCWAKDLQWSYYDHPPMTAYLIRLSTTCFGDSVFGFRVPACLASAFVLFVISRLTTCNSLMWGVALSPLFTVGAVLITPDSPLVMFWAAYLWWLTELHRRLAPLPVDSPIVVPHATIRFWLFGGVLLGCGVLSKYTMGLAVPTAFISLLLIRCPWKVWVPGYVLHGAMAFVVASPILIYNVRQNFEPLLFQWQHSVEKTPDARLSLLDFIGVQILLFGTLPFFLIPWVMVNARRLCQSPLTRACACLYSLPLLFFLYKSTQTRLQGNWALVCFVSFWPVAAVWYESVRASRFWRWSTATAFLPPTLATIVLLVHLIYPLPFVPISGDRAHRQISLNKAMHNIARQIRELKSNLPTYTETYQTTAWLRFESLDARQIDGLTRPSHFTRPPQRLTDVDRALFVAEQPLPMEFCQGFAVPELLFSVPVIVRGETIRTLSTWRYTKQHFSDAQDIP